MNCRLRSFGLALMLGLASLAPAQRGESWMRYRVTTTSPEEVERLADSPLTLFSCNVSLGDTDVIVAPGQFFELLTLDLPFRAVSELPDPATLVNDNRRDLVDYKQDYLTLPEIYQHYDAWRAQNPELVTRQQIGTTIENRPIYAYRFSPYRQALKKPQGSILLMFGIHCREWVSPATGLYLAEKMVQGMKSDRKIKAALSKYAVYIIPVMNPDGYLFTWTPNNRYWRKNRRYNGIVNGNPSYGVDLNRNYSVGWGLNGGSSSNRNSETYRGPSAFSEPETQCVRDFIPTIPPLKGFFDYHSYSQLIMWPWGYQSSLTPDNAAFQVLGNNYRQAVLNHGGQSYVAGPVATTIYIASGVTVDYCYQVHGTKAMTVELRDTGTYGFLLPKEQIYPTQVENWAGFRAYLKDLTGY